ncbi:MAG: hypothetical protein JNM72_05170 [Deltaproteobacteria bacterium]|nr:hypothetical protein [Deltaproteobacteria bacterium]
MPTPLTTGTFVCHDDHEVWGQGVVIDTSGGYVTVLFETGDAPKFNATTRARLIPLDAAEVPADSPLRSPAARVALREGAKQAKADAAELKALPGGLQDLIRVFLNHFPAGFEDPVYAAHEHYKIADLAKAEALLAPVPGLVEAGAWDAAVDAFGRAVGLTNLVHTFEKIRARDIGPGQREAVARAVAGVMAAEGDALGQAVAELGAALRPDGADKWTIVSWVACASHRGDPSCPMIKPMPMQAAAKALGFSLDYAPKLNARTWERSRALYGKLAAEVEAAGLGARSTLELYTLLWYGCGLADRTIDRANGAKG